MDRFTYALRKFLTDIIKVAVTVLLVATAIAIGIGLFMVGMPLALLIALVIVLSIIGHYVNPDENKEAPRFTFFGLQI